MSDWWELCLCGDIMNTPKADQEASDDRCGGKFLAKSENRGVYIEVVLLKTPPASQSQIQHNFLGGGGGGFFVGVKGENKGAHINVFCEYIFVKNNRPRRQGDRRKR